MLMSVVAASVSPVFPVRVDNAENTEWNIWIYMCLCHPTSHYVWTYTRLCHPASRYVWTYTHLCHPASRYV